MVDVKSNKELWGEQYDWGSEGEEWSESWGGADMQWYGTILPRIQQFVPCCTALEIAPGFGRWTRYLCHMAQNLIVIDLAEKCINHCKQKFSSATNIEYHVNDGMSLSMVPDRSVDFVFSYDSLVHAEFDVMQSYIGQLSAKLTQNGIAFLHHSNIGVYQNRRSDLIERNQDHGRAFSVTAEKVRTHIEKSGMTCISQEKINWGGELISDCITVFSTVKSTFKRSYVKLENDTFMLEAKRIKNISPLYGARSFHKSIEI